MVMWFIVNVLFSLKAVVATVDKHIFEGSNPSPVSPGPRP